MRSIRRSVHPGKLAKLIPLLAGIAAALPLLSDVRAGGSPGDDLQLALACPNTGELVIDKIKICYFTCPDMRTSIRIGANDICPPFR